MPMLMRTYLLFHGVTLQFETNSERFFNEILKEFGCHMSDKCEKIDGKINLLEEDKVDCGIPEGAVRDSIVFPSTAMYIHKDKIFLVEEEKYLIIIDPTKYEIEAHAKPFSQIFEKIRFIAKRAVIRLLEDRGLVSIHGSAASDEEGALLFTGVSGSGKTTSLLALLVRGYRMLTDDTILMNEKAVLPFHLRSMIHRDTLERFPSLASAIAKNSTWNDEADGWWMQLGDLYSVQHEPAIPRAVFCTHIWNSLRSSCREIEPTKMLSVLLKSYRMEASIIFPPTPEQLKRAFSVYSKIVEEKPCYHLYIGKDPERLFYTIKEAAK